MSLPTNSPGTPCTRYSSPVAPKVRSSTGTSLLHQQAHQLQPLLTLRNHTLHPQTWLHSRCPPRKCPPPATLSQAHDSNIWALTFHPFGHLYSASNDHTTRFCVRKRPGDDAFVFAPGSAKPAAASPDDDADGDQDEEGDSFVVPGFGGSAAAAAGPGPDGETPQVAIMVGGHVGPGAEDVVPGLGYRGGGGTGSGGNEVRFLGLVGGEGLSLALGVVRTARRCRWRWPGSAWRAAR